ncbi:nonstructural protein [Durania virus]|uniref:Nonstructural protein n=1 Tax=Durania virus TaxID=1006585 RepID=F4ZCK9_9VIRU|nr:nonstructural protein [Durania virus]AEB70978.1 nonstructural protein [Durania virus]
MTSYLFDTPVIVRPNGYFDREVYVTYMAHNKYCEHTVSVHNCMEIPVRNFGVSMLHKESFSDFYILGLFPFRWGDKMGNSRVTRESFPFMKELLADICKMHDSEFFRSFLPNIKKALSWPLGYPSLDFIRMTDPDNSMPHFREISNNATLIMQMGQPAIDLDQGFVNAHKRIVMESITRGFGHKDFPGKNLIFEVASLQCVRMLNAVPADLLYCQITNSLTSTLMKHRAEMESHPQGPLGNQKWIPDPDSWLLDDQSSTLHEEFNLIISDSEDEDE